MPFPSAKKKITFDDVECPEYWCEFKTMARMKYKEVRTMLAGNDPEDNSIDHVSNLLEATILAWNLPEEDGGEVLPIPSTDPTSIQKLPNIIVTHLVNEISGSDGSAESENLEQTS